MYWSPLCLLVSGPATAPQNCGLEVHCAPPGGATITLVLGPRIGSVASDTAPGGSLPKVLHGLPIGAGPLKSAVAERTIVADLTPNDAPNALPTLLLMVTWS